MIQLKHLAKLGSYFINNKELSIVTVIIFVLCMMIVPIPSGLMDVLIAFNITVTLLTLMVVVYMKSPVGLTAFPSILLVLALIRIGITVSTSRLILLDGNAGEIVQTFGEFAIGGNIVVGIIVFVIITIINFIVITKGSERVAEVAARFSLDAMPGKQMSIDSDLKSGNLTMEQAIAKRKQLGLESKLYGAMDGAMKFVKGDSIASIIDIIVNLVGGLIIGIVQKGMSFGDAITTYSVLTIGDGLVQQIPALLVSLTAGIMITRVSDDDEPHNLGQTILSQLFNNHKAIFSSCGLLAIMAFIPGMPSWVFAFFLIVFVIIGFYIWKRFPGGDGKVSNQAIAEEQPVDAGASGTEEVQLYLLPLLLQLSPQFKNTPGMKQLKEIVSSVRQSIANELGISIPQIVIRYDDTYKENQYQLAVFEIPEVTGTMYWDSILMLDEEIKKLIKFDKIINNHLDFGEAKLGFWVDTSYQEICDKNKITYLKYEQFLLLHVKYHISKHIANFVGLQEVKNILDKMNEYQELVKELLRMLPLNKVAEVFQRLIAENISIRNFKVILDSMLEWAQRERDVVLITEYVRRALGRYIAYKFSKGTYLFPCILLSSDLEDTVRDSIRYSDNGNYLSLDPRISDSIVMSMKEILDSAAHIKNPIVLCQFDIRRYVRSIVEKELGFLSVLSFQELEGHAQYNSLGVIEMD